jgi:uncharacterized protein with von Willebrand factor type A (vWA) domain
VTDPAPSAVGARLAAIVPEFCRALRDRAGLPSSPAQVVVLQSALCALGAPDLENLYWAGRACLAIDAAQQPAYDEVFGDYFLGERARPTDEPRDRHTAREEDASGGLPQERVATPTTVTGSPDGPDGSDDAEVRGSRASAIEVLRVTPFAACSEEEQALLRTLIRRLRVNPPMRRSRRMSPTRRQRHVDLRRTARRSMSGQGDFEPPQWRDRRPRPRRVVMFLDVSRSMAPYSRLLLHFAHAVSVSGFHTEVVCFGTRVTRVTRLIRKSRSARALETAAASVLDWDGGTRIGESLHLAQTLGTIRGALRGGVVLVLSDGLEQDTPERLAAALARMRRSCHSLIWANPLAGDPRYEPLTAGMVVALPYIDVLCAGDTLAALQQVAATLGDRP